MTCRRYSSVFRRPCRRDGGYSSTNRTVCIMILSLLVSFLVRPNQMILSFYSIQHTLEENRYLCKLIKSVYKCRYPLQYKALNNYYFVKNLFRTFLVTLQITWLISFLYVVKTSIRILARCHAPVRAQIQASQAFLYHHMTAI